MTYTTYTLVTKLPEGSEWIGDGTAFIQEGCVKAWGYQVPYGRHVVVAHYITPSGERVMLEKYVTRRISEADAWAELKSAGY